MPSLMPKTAKTRATARNAETCRLALATLSLIITNAMAMRRNNCKKMANHKTP